MNKKSNEVSEKQTYKTQMFDEVSKIIEATGQGDSNYSAEEKAMDIFVVLESLLAYTIYTTCISAESVRDSAEESYINIKRQALEMMRQTPKESE